MAPEVLRRGYAVVPRDDQLRGWILTRTQYDPATALDALRHTADDMAWMLKTLRLVIRCLGRSARLAERLQARPDATDDGLISEFDPPVGGAAAAG